MRARRWYILPIRSDLIAELHPFVLGEVVRQIVTEGTVKRAARPQERIHVVELAKQTLEACPDPRAGPEGRVQEPPAVGWRLLQDKKEESVEIDVTLHRDVRRGGDTW